MSGSFINGSIKWSLSTLKFQGLWNAIKWLHAQYTEMVSEPAPELHLWKLSLIVWNDRDKSFSVKKRGGGGEKNWKVGCS